MLKKGKNISESALRVKQQIISKLKGSVCRQFFTVSEDCQDLLEDIKVNTEIIGQIKQLDEEIELLQINIAELREQYEFVGELSQLSSYQQKQMEDTEHQTNFLKQRDIKSRLLAHLYSVEKGTKNIDCKQVLGIDISDSAEQNERKAYY